LTDFNRMTHDARQTETDLERMLSRISHDLRTPLARLRMEIEISNLPRAARLAIDEDLAQINYHIRQLWEYARPASAAPHIATDVSAALNELCEHERNAIESLGGSLNAELEPGLHAYVTSFDVECITEKLIDNARRYGRSVDGRLAIDLRLTTDDSTLILDVSDHGPGILPEDIPRLMQPFWRGEPPRPGDDGIGLGLPIAERLLAQAGGRLRLFNRDGGGLTARIELPKHKH